MLSVCVGTPEEETKIRRSKGRETCRGSKYLKSLAGAATRYVAQRVTNGVRHAALLKSFESNLISRMNSVIQARLPMENNGKNMEIERLVAVETLSAST